LGASRFFDYGVEADAAAPAPVRFLGEATTDDWALIGSLCERRRFSTGEVLCRAGEIDRSLLVVLDGELTTMAERRGRRRSLSPAGAGSVVGEVGFLDGQPRSATVVASTDGELLRLSFSAFERLAAVNPRLGNAILFDLGRILAARLRTLTDVIMTR
jgi:CRP-like cAMP-binding protein